MDISTKIKQIEKEIQTEKGKIINALGGIRSAELTLKVRYNSPIITDLIKAEIRGYEEQKSKAEEKIKELHLELKELRSK